MELQTHWKLPNELDQLVVQKRHSSFNRMRHLLPISKKIQNIAGQIRLEQYRPAPPEILARVRRIEAVCARHAIGLSSAALQFPLGHSLVASVTLGMRSPAEVEQNLESIASAIPADFWAELKQEGLLRADAPTP